MKKKQQLQLSNIKHGIVQILLFFIASILLLFDCVKWLRFIKKKFQKQTKKEEWKKHSQLWYNECKTIVNISLRCTVCCCCTVTIAVAAAAHFFFCSLCVGNRRDKYPMSKAPLICVNVYWHCQLNNLTVRIPFLPIWEVVF